MRRIQLPLLLFVLPATAHAQSIFEDTFENVPLGDISAGSAQQATLLSNGWNGVAANCFGYCSAAIVDAPFGRAGRVLKYSYRSDQDIEPVPEQDQHNNQLSKDFNPPLDELWGRVWFATDVDNTESAASASQWFCCGTKLHYIKPVGAGPSYITGAAYPDQLGATPSMYGTQEMAVCPSGGTPIFKGGDGCGNNFQNQASVAVVDKQWYCMEYHLKLNTSDAAHDGLIEFFIDNTLVQRFADQQMYDGFYTRANSLIGNILVYRQHANHMIRYEDDIAWSTTRIGCGEVVTPAAPSDLSVG